MEHKDKGGIESIVEGSKKRDFFDQIGAYIGTAISSIGAAGSAYMGIFSIYKAIDEYIKVDPETVTLAAMADEYSPYDICYGYIIIALLAGIAAVTFVYGVMEGARVIRGHHN